MQPEYLALFSNSGNLVIKVLFKDSDRSISEQKLNASEIQKLVNPDGKLFIPKIRFDDHLADLEKVDIFVSENRIVLHARLHR